MANKGFQANAFQNDVTGPLKGFQVESAAPGGGPIYAWRRGFGIWHRASRAPVILLALALKALLGR